MKITSTPQNFLTAGFLAWSFFSPFEREWTRCDLLVGGKPASLRAWGSDRIEMTAPGIRRGQKEVERARR